MGVRAIFYFKTAVGLFISKNALPIVNLVYKLVWVELSARAKVIGAAPMFSLLYMLPHKLFFELLRNLVWSGS